MKKLFAFLVIFALCASASSAFASVESDDKYFIVDVENEGLFFGDTAGSACEFALTEVIELASVQNYIEGRKLQGEMLFLHAISNGVFAKFQNVDFKKTTLYDDEEYEGDDKRLQFLSIFEHYNTKLKFRVWLDKEKLRDSIDYVLQLNKNIEPSSYSDDDIFLKNNGDSSYSSTTVGYKIKEIK